MLKVNSKLIDKYLGNYFRKEFRQFVFEISFLR